METKNLKPKDEKVKNSLQTVSNTNISRQGSNHQYSLVSAPKPNCGEQEISSDIQVARKRADYGENDGLKPKFVEQPLLGSVQQKKIYTSYSQSKKVPKEKIDADLRAKTVPATTHRLYLSFMRKDLTREALINFFSRFGEVMSFSFLECQNNANYNSNFENSKLNLAVLGFKNQTSLAKAFSTSKKYEIEGQIVELSKNYPNSTESDPPKLIPNQQNSQNDQEQYQTKTKTKKGSKLSMIKNMSAQMAKEKPVNYRFNKNSQEEKRSSNYGFNQKSQKEERSSNYGFNQYYNQDWQRFGFYGGYDSYESHWRNYYNTQELLSQAFKKKKSSFIYLDEF